jgi:MerR family redox-sensitive transcriptional activator SoxR
MIGPFGNEVADRTSVHSRTTLRLKAHLKSRGEIDVAQDVSIGEVARRAGVSTSAIRYYEQAGLMPPPTRSSGQRRYHSAVLDRLALIQFARRAGFTIAEIRTLFEGFADETPASERWQTLARRKLAEIDGLMDRIERMRTLLGQALACGCLELDQCARAMGSCSPVGSDQEPDESRSSTKGNALT